MPATSRSGLRFRRRSGSDRAGSPSKSRITQSSPSHNVWPRWKSPCTRITRPVPPMFVRRRNRSRTSSPRPRIGSRSGASSGSDMNTRSISSSTVAVRRPSDSAEVCSGQKVGSAGSEPRTVCIRPVTSPRRLSVSKNASSPATIASSARSHPSSPLATKRCIVPSVASICAPTYAYQPVSSAMFSNSAPVKKRSSSSSGLIPASTRRNTFRIWASSKMTDEFDCSPSTSRAACGSRTSEPTEANSTAPSSAWTVSPVRISSSKVRACASSASASKPLPSVSSWYVSCVPVSKRTSTS